MQFVSMADNKLMSSRWPQTSRTIWPTLKYDLIITCSNHKNELLSMPSFALQSRRSFQPFLKILSILKFLIRLLTLSSINIPCMASRHKSLLGFQPTLLREGWWNRARWNPCLDKFASTLLLADFKLFISDLSQAGNWLMWTSKIQSGQEFWTTDGNSGILPPLWAVKKILGRAPPKGTSSEPPLW